MVTEVTRQGYFSRIGNSIMGVLIGIVLSLAAFPVLFWNEGRAVQTAKSLDEGQGAVVSVSADKVDQANEGKLVHISAKAVTDETLTDEVFGVSLQAIRLNRNVNMYQWEEKSKSRTKKKIGGGTETITEYTYHKTWSDSVIDSSGFKETSGHENPTAKPYESETFVAKNVTAGAFKLTASLVGSIRNNQPLKADAEQLPQELKEELKPHSDGYYIGENPGTPAIGDARLKWVQTPFTDVSVIAQQVGQTFEPYQTKAGDALNILEVGTMSAEQMFKLAHERNKMMTWLLRGAGFGMMLIGFALIMKPLSVIADVIPIAGDIVGAGTFLVAVVGSLALSAGTVGVAWIFYRPLIGAPLLAGTVILLGFLIVKGRGRKKADAITAA